ncbi:peptidyl-prolyl cis-trans isomerase [Flammeovirgaceae bacterium SG7u.111]|nr:peptidyl-prolyl cis-trans isomerase [Flammeovirgaceae bacterium SG7u.132]WPO37415.1 peptidyl-prolyl cis-trans isomerase [Flammeovirgaceae bacterium SG7u.111]
MNKLIYLALLVLISSCDQFKFSDKEEEEDITNAVARVGDVYLYQRDLGGLIDKSMSSEDSANIIGRYVDSWVKKQLMLQSAEENYQFDEAEIDRRVLDYRYQLIVYGYEKQFVQLKLDTAISEEEIREYYEENLDNFQLKQNIIKGSYLKIPNEAPRLKRVSNWLRSNDKNDLEKLRSYAYSYAESFSINDSNWIDFDQYVYNTPFVSGAANPVQLLERNKYLEVSDSLYSYFLRIDDYKITDQVSPLEFVREQIKSTLITKRMVGLRKDLENEVYENAEKNKSYEVYQ